MFKVSLVVFAVLVVIGAGMVVHDKQNQPVIKSVAKTVAKKISKVPSKVQIKAGLENSWKTALANTKTPVDIAVYDHASGATAHYTNVAARTFSTASTMKLSILEALLLQDQDNGISGLTDTQLASAEPMIENSNNDAATTLVVDAGGSSGMNSFFASIGATSSTMGDHWGLTQTTALDQLKVVGQLAYPTKLNADAITAANYLLDRVETDQRWGVSAGVPEGVTVRLKNGWLQDDDGSWIINSIGYVRGNGQDYTIAVYTDQNATEPVGIATIELLSTATWNYLSSLKR